MNTGSPSVGKVLSAPSISTHSQPPAQAIPSPIFESSRRQSQSPSQTPSQLQSAPRKNQSSRRQHRNQQRPDRGNSNSLRGPGRLDEEDAIAEMRAVRNPTSRRGQTSITHLLNYSLPPPPRPYNSSSYGGFGHSSRSYRQNPSWGPGSGYHAADKARYVHANYRFVVLPVGDYAAAAADADHHLDWADVLQVIVSDQSQQAACPICLDEPVAPRMAKCGHIFCLPCLLRFMSSGTAADQTDTARPHDYATTAHRKQQNRWRKCPICEDTVHLAEVRPVRFYAGQESPPPRPGDDVVLRLMMRRAKSTLALPKEGGADVLQAGDDVPWQSAANVMDYARIMKGTGAYMGAEFDREVEHLQAQEKEDELLFNQDTEWTQKAVRAIAAAKERVAGLGEDQIAAAAAAAAATTAAATASTRRRQHEMDFYFYESPPHLYLSPLDIRILKTKYGAFSAFPSTLLPRVEHISTGHVVDDALRARAKYLGHLPQGCVISFLECDWTDIVPADILAAFAADIERRRKRNRDKAAQEERERAQAERLEAAAVMGMRRTIPSAQAEEEERLLTLRFGGGGGGNGSSSHDELAAVDMNDFVPLGAEHPTVTTTSSSSIIINNSGRPGSTPPRRNPWPGFATLTDLSTSPSAPRTVWGTPAVPASPSLPPRSLAAAAAADDGWLDDDVLESLGAASVAFQMEALDIAGEGEGEDDGGDGGVSGGDDRGGGGGGASALAVADGLSLGGGGGGGDGDWKPGQQQQQQQQQQGGGPAGKGKKKKHKITLMSTGSKRGV